MNFSVTWAAGNIGFRRTQLRAERYLQHFDEIWRLQSHLLSEADRGQVPIIVNNNKEQVIRDIMSVIMDVLVDRLDAPPSEVFT